MSIATLSIGLDAISVTNGAKAFFDGDFLDAHFAQFAHHCSMSCCLMITQ
jgi:hypothetical protein